MLIAIDCKRIVFVTEEIAFGPVGFTAYASANERYGAYDTVVYDTVVTNYGGAYDSDTGIFTCPVTGDYDVPHQHQHARLGQIELNYCVIPRQCHNLNNCFVNLFTRHLSHGLQYRTDWRLRRFCGSIP